MMLICGTSDAACVADAAFAAAADAAFGSLVLHDRLHWRHMDGLDMWPPELDDAHIRNSYYPPPHIYVAHMRGWIVGISVWKE
jgi:hypothetical protein